MVLPSSVFRIVCDASTRHQIGVICHQHRSGWHRQACNCERHVFTANHRAEIPEPPASHISFSLICRCTRYPMMRREGRRVPGPRTSCFCMHATLLVLCHRHSRNQPWSVRSWPGWRSSTRVRDRRLPCLPATVEIPPPCTMTVPDRVICLPTSSFAWRRPPGAAATCSSGSKIGWVKFYVALKIGALLLDNKLFVPAA